MKNYLKFFNTHSSSAGFTLIELMIAASLTTIVVSLAGFGLVTMTERNKKAKIETDRRVELNRALDFIADEVRQAKPIATDADANLTIVAPAFSLTFDTPVKTRIPVLTLQIPDVQQRVIYYIAPKATNSLWLGPKIVYRWGPSFAANGTYSNPSTPGNWTHEPLADLIVDTIPSPNPNCQTGWSPNPSVASRTGFYACVDPSGRIADIHLHGKLTNAYGNSIDPFKVSTKAFARPNTPTFTTSTATDIKSGTVTFTQASTAYFEVLGGSMDCPGKGEIPTTTTLKVTPPGGTMTSTLIPSSTKALNVSGAAGTTITVSGFADNSFCYGATDYTFNSETNKDRQVWTLRNGDTPPPFAPYGT